MTTVQKPERKNLDKSRQDDSKTEEPTLSWDDEIAPFLEAQKKLLRRIRAYKKSLQDGMDPD